ncbi:glycosyltransferase [Agromyces sp. H66]|uniref:glycosyltransferase family 2 protein n=1 Tax=Agromyces sp. H66 TaxID=2529859 RepID=UPI001B7D7FF5|nr:glycosyltransferase [Agromyces sp. H66]
MTLDIMMPFYGRVDHFKLAVQSVLAQDDPDWRLVVVDDVYPDLSAGEWLVGLGDDRITYLRNEENLRPSRNYRKCVGLMQTEFAVIMGCDDIMRPGYVRRVKELTARFPHAAVIQPGVEVIDADGQVYHPLADRVKRRYMPRGARPLEISGEAAALSLVRAAWFYFPSLVWNVERLRRHEFRADLDVTQDIAMVLDLVTDGGSVVVDDEVVFRYRRHAESVSAVTGPDGSKFAQERTVFAEADRDLRAMGWNRAARAARWHLSSRLHALADLPKAIGPGKSVGRRRLLRHVFGGLDPA